MEENFLKTSHEVSSHINKIVEQEDIKTDSQVAEIKKSQLVLDKIIKGKKDLYEKFFEYRNQLRKLKYEKQQNIDDGLYNAKLNQEIADIENLIMDNINSIGSKDISKKNKQKEIEDLIQNN